MSEAARRSRITVMLLYTYLEPLVSTELMAAVTRLTDKPADATAETSTAADENKVAETGTIAYKSKVSDAGTNAESDMPTADGNVVVDTGTVAYKSKVADGNMVAEAGTVADRGTDTGAVVDAEEATEDGVAVDKSESDTSNDYRKVQELLIYLRDIAEYLKRVA